MSDALKVSGLCVGYGKVEALYDANLTVRQGSIVTVIGPNGAGKTTLLSALIGLLPSRGSVCHEGDEISQHQVEERVARGMCLVPERRELFGELRVEDNLLLGAFPRLRHGMGGILTELKTIYERFPRLKERRAQRASTLSGGERQMLALGRALMAKPRLLMLDEPSLGLAPLIVRDIFHIIADLKKTGVSILLVEQNTQMALDVASRGLVMELGRVVLQGPAQTLRHDEKLAHAYLGQT